MWLLRFSRVLYRSFIERHEFEGAAWQFAIIANGHDEIQAIDRDSLPAVFFGFFAEPLSGDFRPDFFANEGSFLVTNPACLARENENGIAGERNQHVNVAMNDFKTGRVAHGPLKAGVLIATHDEGIDLFRFHGRANIFVAAIDLV